MILGLSDECQEKYPLLEGNGHEGLRTNHLRAAPPRNVSDRQEDPVGSAPEWIQMESGHTQRLQGVLETFVYNSAT